MRLKVDHKRGLLCILFALILLAGCSTKSSKTRVIDEAHQSGIHYLTLATNAIPIQALEYRLQASVFFIQAGELNQAQRVLRESRSNTYPLDPYLNKSILNARLALLNRDTSKALTYLKSMLHSLSQNPKSYTAQASTSNNSAPHIALLLPSKGQHSEAAKTIRDGFLAAYYQSIQHQASDPTVKLYDTEQGKKVEEAYQRAINDRATFIVGPLTKAEVQTMARIDLTIPVLTLNTLSESAALPRDFFQFGLMPEDEVIAAAEHAMRLRFRTAIVLAINGEWGRRLASTFKEYWTSHQGQVIETHFFKPGQDLNAKIKSLRQGVDMIFIAAPTDIAKQIKPLLNFYYPEHTPVYATSAVYSGRQDPKHDQDLNGIRFCDMPWILQQTPSNPSPSPRFFAFGMDAYRLANQLSKTKSLPSYGFSGYTGELSLNEQYRIQRGLVCAKFEHGVPVPD